ncbi:hypothetical protein [Phenylobacterium aquaticum]|uniref:hypothetical protein n=1 Tax=Phenylobacterium aquaticum TaxID=1763816 RepID=UPI001F5C93F2|nr:hypothetical protein [Phenylobacterium aquaticum]MCI3130793.1 hypothetical protein [Phenylobacterium aquaticum]
MSECLDRLMADLAATPTDARFESMESEVIRRIVALRAEARVLAELLPVRVASVVLALAMGVTTGAALVASAIVTPRPYAVLSSAGHFAPSTLLEGRD